MPHKILNLRANPLDMPLSHHEPLLQSPLSAWLASMQEHRKITQATADIIQAIVSTGPAIQTAIQRSSGSPLPNTTSTNASGETQHPLDLEAQAIIMHGLHHLSCLKSIISEEQDEVIYGHQEASYMLAIDPLDGTSNLPSNAPVGTIFSIYQTPGSTSTPLDHLQKGTCQLAAGYLLYGSTITLVLSLGEGVHQWSYEIHQDQFLCTRSSLRLPDHGIGYSVNESYYEHFNHGVQRYIQQCRRQGMTARYSGSLVADFHRHLVAGGGIYMYPSTTRHPHGKLRLTLECNAMAMIAEQAGGAASNGQHRIMSIQPQHIHQTTAFYIGSANDITSLERQLAIDD